MKFIKKFLQRRAAKKYAEFFFAKEYIVNGDDIGVTGTDYHVYILALMCFSKRVKQICGKELLELWESDINYDNQFEVLRYNTADYYMNYGKNTLNQVPVEITEEDMMAKLREVHNVIRYSWLVTLRILEQDVMKDFDPKKTPNDLTEKCSVLLVEVINDYKKEIDYDNS